MNRSFLIALAAAASLALSAPAFAHGEGQDRSADYPMKADVFQAKVDARLAKAKARLEARITEKQLTADQAKALRDRFAERSTRVEAAAAEAEKDGVVTYDEAKAVHEAGGWHHKNA